MGIKECLLGDVSKHNYAYKRQYSGLRSAPCGRARSCDAYKILDIDTLSSIIPDARASESWTLLGGGLRRLLGPRILWVSDPEKEDRGAGRGFCMEKASTKWVGMKVLATAEAMDLD